MEHIGHLILWAETGSSNLCTVRILRDAANGLRWDLHSIYHALFERPHSTVKSFFKPHKVSAIMSIADDLGMPRPCLDVEEPDVDFNICLFYTLDELTPEHLTELQNDRLFVCVSGVVG